MRLIDANEFKRFLHEQVGAEDKFTADEIMQMIDEQQTVTPSIKELHENLLKMPAEDYLEFYHMMKDRVKGKVYIMPEIPVVPKLKKGGKFPDEKVRIPFI